MTRVFRGQDPAWKPDFGPCELRPSWGATAVGARKFLLAYNVNLMCTKEQATKIAFNIRTRGRGEGKVSIYTPFMLGHARFGGDQLGGGFKLTQI